MRHSCYDCGHHCTVKCGRREMVGCIVSGDRWEEPLEIEVIPDEDAKTECDEWEEEE